MALHTAECVIPPRADLESGALVSACVTRGRLGSYVNAALRG